MSASGVRALVPLAHVESVPRTIAFYQRLGFTVENTVHPEGVAEPTWTWLKSGDAHLMFARAGEPVVPSQQAVLFYLYCEDVEGFRASLQAAGISCGEVGRPFWAPRGEFRVTDPDGYVLMVSHT